MCGVSKDAGFLYVLPLGVYTRGMNQKALSYLAIFALIIIASTFFIPVSDTQAFFGGSTGGLSPFGGMVTKFIVCTCSSSILITVGSPVGGDFLVTPGTKLYANFNFMPGHWVLGLALPASLPCMVYAGTSCVNVGNGKPIIMMGTS